MSLQKLRVRMSLHELEKPENEKKLHDFLKAWRIIQSLPPDNPNSFWAIASYHGMPFKKRVTKNDHDKKVWGGYCQHANVLFPTWHRLYLLKIEHALQTALPDGDIALHYWDETSDESLINGLPNILTVEKVTIDGQEVRNPLKSFILNKEIEGEKESLYKKPINYETQRYPYSGIVNPKEAAEFAREHNSMLNNLNESKRLLQENLTYWLNSGKPNAKVTKNSVLEAIKNCLQESDYNSFSNNSSVLSKSKISYSLEQPHNDIHLAIGGYAMPDKNGNIDNFGFVEGSNGDMGENETASFDPIFYFHHSFIDRIFWMWQKNWNHCTVENSFEIRSENVSSGQGPTPNQTFDEVLTMDTILYPFQNSMGVPQSSRDCVDIEKQLGYTYGPGSLETKVSTEMPSLNVKYFDVKSLKTMELFMSSPAFDLISSQSRLREVYVDFTENTAPRKDWEKFFTTSKYFLFGTSYWKHNFYILVKNIDKNKYPGSFIVRVSYKQGENEIFIGQKGVLGRWDRSNCLNCQAHNFISIHMSCEKVNSVDPLEMKNFRTKIISKDPFTGKHKTTSCDDNNKEYPTRQLWVLFKEFNDIPKEELPCSNVL